MNHAAVDWILIGILFGLPVLWGLFEVFLHWLSAR